MLRAISIPSYTASFLFKGIDTPQARTYIYPNYLKIYMVNRKRLRRNKKQGMTRRAVTNKKPMSAERKAERKKIRETQKAAALAANSKKK